jgi:alcohol dehydrogenase, propanol-preferring
MSWFLALNLILLHAMKAARLLEPRGQVVVTEVEVPEPGPGEVLVRTQACGLCHSDLFIAGLSAPPRMPLTLGHEAIGTVEKAGREAEQYAPGDRVALTFLHSACGACEFCHNGRPELCPRQANTGYHVDGAFAEFAIARESFLTRIPDGLDAVKAAPLSCAGWTAFHAVNSAGLQSGSWLAIFGIGGLGQLAIQFARLSGLKVAAIDLSAEKLAIASTLGAELTINAGEQDPARTLRKSIGGAHGAVSFVASAGAVRGAFDSLRRTGVLVLVGLETETFELPLVDIVLKAVKVQGSFLGSRQELEQVFALASQGRIQVDADPCSLEELPVRMEQMETGSLRRRAVVKFF